MRPSMAEKRNRIKIAAVTLIVIAMLFTAALAMRRKVPQSVAECFDLIEREMFAGPWVMGKDYTVCDPYLFTLAQWMEADGVDPARFPRVNGHLGRMSERPAVKRALEQEVSPAGDSPARS